MTSSRHLLATFLLTLALAAAGCGDAVEGAGTPADPDETAPAVDDNDGAGTTVRIGPTDLGDVLVDGEGMTLYVFDPDEQGPSTCYDDCATAWPPLLTDGDPVAEGDAEQELLGAIERDDGALQATYDGWPLYHWAADASPGDASGQAVQDVWWVVAADGQPVRNTPGDDNTDDDTTDDDTGRVEY
jgi:predicted lipoprotein with Yx(FWY)xxD motif